MTLQKSYIFLLLVFIYVFFQFVHRPKWFKICNVIHENVALKNKRMLNLGNVACTVSQIKSILSNTISPIRLIPTSGNQGNNSNTRDTRTRKSWIQNLAKRYIYKISPLTGMMGNAHLALPLTYCSVHTQTLVLNKTRDSYLYNSEIVSRNFGLCRILVNEK